MLKQIITMLSLFQ